MFDFLTKLLEQQPPSSGVPGDYSFDEHLGNLAKDIASQRIQTRAAERKKKIKKLKGVMSIFTGGMQ